ncbi:GPI inositol deacylase [Podila epigama]|nr:GPI inositol deacylase [Podila epigama]
MSKSIKSRPHPSDPSDQDDSSHHLGGTSTSALPSSLADQQQQQQHHLEQHSRSSEQSKLINGYIHESATGHLGLQQQQQQQHRPSHPIRRPSSTVHSNGPSPSTSSSLSSSIPLSPSLSSSPFNHISSNHSHIRVVDKESSHPAVSNGHGILDSVQSTSTSISTPTSTLISKSTATGTTTSTSNSTPKSRMRSKSHPDLPPPTSLDARYRSPSFGCSYAMISLFLISFTVLGCIFHSNFYHQVDVDRCDPIYMQPKYFKLLGFDRERTAFAGKYGLFLFRDQYDYKLQVDPSLLTAQGNYVWTVEKDAKGRQADPILPQPTSVMIIGHSMGGIVARSLFTMDNYKPGSVNMILTAATPHMVPPVTLDFEISNIYDRIESFWTRGFVGPDAPLQNVSLISIAGGNRDIIVNSDSGNIHNFVPQSHGFTVFTASIPHAWVGSDHLSILWCNQIAVVVGKALIDVVDATLPEQIKPLPERMAIFRNRLLTGLETHLNPPVSEAKEIFTLSSIGHTFIDESERLALPLRNTGNSGQDTGNSHLYIMEVPWESNKDTFSLLTDHTFGSNSRMEIMLCNDVSTTARTASSTPSKLSCHIDTLSAIPIPSSMPQPAVPNRFGDLAPIKEFRFVSKSVEDLSAAQYVVILDRGSSWGHPGFLVAEFMSENESTITATTSTLGLLNNGFRIHAFPERPSLVSTLRLPNIDNSLLTYKLFVDRQGCNAPQRFSPLLRQSSWTMYEYKYSVDIINEVSGVDINFHGDVPYYERIQLPGKKGVELKFWMDPTCPVPLTINLQVDKYGSLGKVVIRYRMVVLVFTFLVVVLTLRAQFKRWNQGGPFTPFGMMLSELIKSTFLKFSVLLAVIAFVQSLQARTLYSFMEPVVSNAGGSRVGWDAAQELIRGPKGSLQGSQATSGGMREQTVDPFDRMVQERIVRADAWFPNLRLANVLLGANDTFLWFLAPVFFQLAVGLVILFWVILNGLVRSVAGFLSFVSRRGGRFVVGKAIGNILSKRSRGVRRRIISTIVLFILVATFVPYQFAFVVAVLVHTVACVRSLLVAQAINPSKSQAAWDRHHYLMSIFVMFFLLLPCTLPVLMVWIRNLSVQWYEPFSSDHRLDYIAPFIFFVEAVTDGAMVPRTPEKGWQIFFMSRIWIVWLLVLQLKDTELVQKVLKSVINQCQRYFRPNKKRK